LASAKYNSIVRKPRWFHEYFNPPAIAVSSGSRGRQADDGEDVAHHVEDQDPGQLDRRQEPGRDHRHQQLREAVGQLGEAHRVAEVLLRHELRDRRLVGDPLQ
jgi:hypothetical protein